jgi:hypothetical protein
MPEVKETPLNCKFFGEKLGIRWLDNDTGVGVYSCGHRDHLETTLEQCWSCKDYLEVGVLPKKEDFGKASEKSKVNAKRGVRQRRNKDLRSEIKRQPQNVLVDRNKTPLPLADHFKGAPLFLILSGPSVLTCDLTKLRHRGILTMGVNNSPTVFRTNLWTFVDPGKKFHHGIWYDPYILKLVPERRFKDKVRVKKDTGEFETSDDIVTQVPNMVGYRRNAFFNPDTWLWEDSINWGNSLKSSEANGHPRVLSVMLAALRQAFYLGMRRVYLVGCDFRMKLENPQNYAFPQARTLEAIGSNNAAYFSIAGLLSLLKPRFDEAGYEIYNCCAESGLKLFPYIPFEDAVVEATKRIPETLDTEGWYD